MLWKILGALCIALTLYEFAPVFFGEEQTSFGDMRLVGEVWHGWAPDSLQLLQPAIERHIWNGPWIWSAVVLPFLLMPIWLIFFILGCLFLLMGVRSSLASFQD